MLYEEIPELSREEMEERFKNGSPIEVAYALHSASLYDSDLEWVQQKCLEYLRGSNIDLRYVALIAVSNVARIHHTLKVDEVMEQIRLAELEPALEGTASIVRRDVEMCLGLSTDESESEYDDDESENDKCNMETKDND